MHIVESPNPPNDMRRSYGIWGKLFGWFWAINPCILVESSQLSMKVINSFVVQKKTFQVFRFQCTLNIYTELHTTIALHIASFLGITMQAQRAQDVRFHCMSDGSKRYQKKQGQTGRQQTKFEVEDVCFKP